MSTPPAVSVCLTAYKRGHALPATIDSLLAQTFGDFELIIADDASPDDTEEVCRRFARADTRIRYIRQPKNVGMPANLNTAIAASSAPLIANLHDGDVYRPDLLAVWTNALEAQPDAAFVFNAYVRLDEHGRELGLMSSGLPCRFERLELVKYMLDPIRCFNSPVWGTVMGRRRCYDEVGGFDAKFSFVSDVALWLRSNLRFPVAYVDAPLIKLHARESDRPLANADWDLEQLIVEMYRDAARGAYTPDEAAGVLATMRRIQERRWLASLASCLRREQYNRAETALAAFRKQRSILLGGAARLSAPVVGAARRSALVRGAVRSFTRSLERARRLTRTS